MRAPSRAAGEVRPVVAGAVLLAVVVAIAWVGLFADLRHDDAFITLRYGENLARGRGLVFAPGAAVMGSTSPGMCLVSALVHALAGHAATPSIVSALGCLAWVAEAVAVALLLAPVAGEVVALGVGACVALGAAQGAEHVALETHEALALGLFAALAMRAGRLRTAAALVALAGLARPDEYLWLAPLTLLAWRARPRPLAAALVFAAPTLAWLAFAWLAYRALLPQSAATKFARVALGDYAAHLATHVPRTWLGAWCPAPVAWLAWPLAFAGGAYLARRDRGLAALAAFTLLHVAGYLVLRPFKQHVWHLYPPAVGTLALGVGGAAAWARPRLGRAGAPVVAVALGCMALAYVARTARFAATYRDAYWFGGRDTVYDAVSAYLLAHGRPDDVVSSFEVGTLAYTTDLEINDLGGLVTRDPLAVYRDPAARARLRWVVLDDTLPEVREKLVDAPVAAFEHGGFSAYVYALGERP